MVFSKKYSSFSDWAQHYILTKGRTNYYYRIVGFLYENPEATLKQARGRHPPAKKVELSEFRTSVVMNGIPIHREYNNFLLQAWDWDSDYLADLKPKLQDLMLKLVSEYLGYEEDEFWFGYVLGYEYPRESGPYDERIDGTWKFQVEKDGRILYVKYGYTKNL